MVIVHRDNLVYQVDSNAEYSTKLLWGFYYEKFTTLLDKHNISYKLVDYENYNGNFYIGRFAHAHQDKELHSEYFDDLYDYYGEKMWPNKRAYYYYDNKIRQYELLEKYGLQVPSIICNNLDELLKNVTIGTVVKSTYGAGAESVFWIWDKSDLDRIQKYIDDSYNSKNFFPCLIQELKTELNEHKIVITNDEVYGTKSSFTWFDNPNKLRNIGHWSNQTNDIQYDKSSAMNEDDFGILDEVIKIKEELNTPNLKFDLINGKVTEFSYLYSELVHQINSQYYTFYNLHKNKFDEKRVSVQDFSYKQHTSVLKHFKLI